VIDTGVEALQPVHSYSEHVGKDLRFGLQSARSAH